MIFAPYQLILATSALLPIWWLQYACVVISTIPIIYNFIITKVPAHYPLFHVGLVFVFYTITSVPYELVWLDVFKCLVGGYIDLKGAPSVNYKLGFVLFSLATPFYGPRWFIQPLLYALVSEEFKYSWIMSTSLNPLMVCMVVYLTVYLRYHRPEEVQTVTETQEQKKKIFKFPTLSNPFQEFIGSTATAVSVSGVKDDDVYDIT